MRAIVPTGQTLVKASLLKLYFLLIVAILFLLNELLSSVLSFIIKLQFITFIIILSSVSK